MWRDLAVLQDYKKKESEKREEHLGEIRQGS